MPKMKSHSGTKKRVSKTATGKLVRRQASVSHYLEHKPGTKRRRLQRESKVSKADAPRMKKLLGS